MRPNLDNVQALRGVACLIVVLFHISQWEAQLGIGKPFFALFKWFGYAGVDLFFVISGFIITHSNFKRLGKWDELGIYLFRRLWRVYPLYWISLGVSIAITAFVYGHHVRPLDWAGHAPAWFGLWPGPHLFLPQAWTLTFELMFYLAFGLFFLFPIRFGVALFGLYAVGLFAVAITGWQSSNPLTQTATSPYVLEFLAGSLVSVVIRQGWTGAARPALTLALVWMIVGSLLLNHRDSNWLMTAARPRVLVFGLPAVLIVYALISAECHSQWRMPRWSLLLGNASYSIYLIHMPIGHAMMLWTIEWSHRRLPHVGWSIAMLAACVGGGLLMYWLIERPLMNLVKPHPTRKPVDGSESPNTRDRKSFSMSLPRMVSFFRAK